MNLSSTSKKIASFAATVLVGATSFAGLGDDLATYADLRGDLSLKGAATISGKISSNAKAAVSISGNVSARASVSANVRMSNRPSRYDESDERPYTPIRGVAKYDDFYSEQNYGRGHHHRRRGHHERYEDQRTCAIVYSSDYKYSGNKLVLAPGDAFSDLSNINQYGSYQDWDNEIESVDVKPNCQVIAYQYKNYDVNLHTGALMGGFALSLTNFESDWSTRTFDLRRYQDNRISSLECSCY